MTDARTPGGAALDRPTERPWLRTPGRRRAARRWWRRRPVTRLMVWLHRWPALVLGLLLVIECTSGAILLYNADYFRATHGDLYHHSASAAPVSDARALDIVAAVHPSFDASWVSHDGGVYVVGNGSYDWLWFVDPGTGHINGQGRPDSGVMGFLGNLHDCGLTCEGEPGYVAWPGNPVWDGGPTFLTGITWAALILGVLGCLMILLVLTSLRIWWPGWKKLGSRAKVRTRRGRFARDYDLHNVIGAVALPFILMWGITGAAFEFPGVENGWLAITGGRPSAIDQPFSLTPRTAPAGTPAITFEQAVSVAETEVGGTATWIGRPTADVPYWEVDVQTGYASSRYRAVYNGDAYVLIDPHFTDNTVVISGGRGESGGNRFYDKFLEPTHFGWNVNGWWRVIWAAFGLAPLALMVTGVSTWLFRRGVQKRRRAAMPTRTVP